MFKNPFSFIGRTDYGLNPKGVGNQDVEKVSKVQFKNTGLILGIFIIFIAFNIYPDDLRDEADSLKIKKDAVTLQMYLDMYAELYGKYPSDEQGIIALVEKPTKGDIPENYKPIINSKSAILDPWGTPYILKNDTGELQIITLGKDKKEGGDGKNADFDILKEDQKNTAISIYKQQKNISLNQSPPHPLDVFNFADEFRINTADIGEAHFVKLKLTLGYDTAQPTLATELVTRTPQMQSIVNLIISRKSKEELKTLYNQLDLRDEIKAHINHILKNGKIKEVYFREFIVN